MNSQNNLLLKLSDIYYSQLCTNIIRDYVKLIKTNFLRSVENAQMRNTHASQSFVRIRVLIAKFL